MNQLGGQQLSGNAAAAGSAASSIGATRFASIRRIWSLPATVFVTCLVVFQINARPIAEVDCIAAPYVTWSMVRHGSLDLSYYPDLDRLKGHCIFEVKKGQWVSMRPIGGSLVALPVIAPLAVFMDQPPKPKVMLLLGKLTASLCVAGAAVLFYLTCRRLAPSAALPATVVFAFGTCLWTVASQALWMHGPATFWLTLSFFLLLRPIEQSNRRNEFFAGLAFGLAVLTRPTTALFALGAGFALLCQRRWKSAFWLTFGGTIPVLILVLMNWQMFGHPLLGGYGQDNWNRPTSLATGLTGLLIAPSRGLFVYTPALVLLPLGLWRLARTGDRRIGQHRIMLFALVAAALPTLFFYARWYDWRGGWCYGPRFLCETMPVLCAVFAIAYASLKKFWSIGIANMLIALSIAVHFAGIFGHDAYTPWQLRHNNGNAMFESHDSQIEAHTIATVERFGRYVTGSDSQRRASK